jgi:hypothetical protein
MNIIVLLLVGLFIAFVMSVIAVKKGWLSDRDDDGIADVIEDKIDEAEELAKKVTRKKPGRKKKS